MRSATLTARALRSPTELVAFPTWPQFSREQIEGVAGVLRSGKVNYWTGNEVREFEKEYAEASGTRHAIALANGTVTLELALSLLGVAAGDEVITTPRTFIASASSIVLRGAKPVFADVDRNSQNITAQSIERVLTPRTKAILVVHLAGWPCDMEPIMALAQAHGVAVIEDCAQAHGAAYRGKPIGSFGAFGSFSFCQDKIITTGGEGGMLVTDDEQLWSRAWAYKDHGKSYNAVYLQAHGPGFRWVHEGFGTNWRMTEMQGVLGRLQLKRLREWIARRGHNARILIDGLSDLDCLRIPVPPAHVTHAYYKFYVFLDPKRIDRAWTRDRVIKEINARGVPCFSGSCSEVYLEKAFDGHASRPLNRLPNARELGDTSLMFLVHPTLTDSHMASTVEVTREVLRFAARR